MLDFLAQAASTVSPPTSTGMGTDALLVGAAVGVVNGLIEAIKSLAAKKKNGHANGNGNSQYAACPECRLDVKRTLQIVSQPDSNGAPLVYGGHQIANNLGRVADELAAVSRKLDREVDHGRNDSN